MNTTKKPSRTCGNTGAGRLLIFYTILRYALTTASYSCLLRRFLIQIECYECIKQVRYPYRYDGRHITIHCKCRGIRLEQDMREFELYGTVHAVVSICDSMNYLMEYEDLVQVVRLANNYLDPHGVFIFDLNTVYKYREELGEQTIAENREESSFIWENFYDEEEMVNEYDLTLFIREEDGRYGKYEETHYQRAYELETVKKAIAEGGMELVAIYDAFTHEAPTEESERVYVIARERGKE